MKNALQFSPVQWLTIGVFVLLALGVRLVHLGGPPDIPDWRQGDTAYMALRMMDESPPEMLHPKAPFRGPKDVKAAEYPIYPLSVSLVYKALGHESLPAARVVTLAFFLGGLVYLYRAVALLFGTQVAALTGVLYLMLPLGMPYSRMVHPDFCIIFFSHAYFYHALRYLRDSRWGSFVWATLACTAAFLMKAPYAFYFGLALGVYALWSWDRSTVRNLVALAAMVVLPLAAALWFNDFRIQLEAGETESLLYPMRWTPEALNARFFGNVAQRFDWSLWGFFVKRLILLVATPLGALGALAGALLLFRPVRPRAQATAVAWCFGMLLYVLLVFPIVTSNHDYYSLPFVAPFALLIALAVDALLKSSVVSKSGLRRVLALSLCLGAIGAGSAYGLQRGPFLYGPPYFQHDWQRIGAAQVIARETPPDSLVLSVTLGRSTGWSDPRILHMANRRGWAIEYGKLDREAVALFRRGGADYAALLVTPAHPEEEWAAGVLGHFSHQVFPMRDPKGGPIGTLVLFELFDGTD